MKIYIDSGFNCRLEPGQGRRQQETGFFPAGAERELIESYRFLPPGEHWMREDGRVFTGPMIWPGRELSGAENAVNEKKGGGA